MKRQVLFKAFPKLSLLVPSRECGNEPRDSLKGNHEGWLIRVIPSFPAERQQISADAK